MLGIILDNMLHVIRKSYEVGKLHAIYIQAHVYLEATSYDIKLWHRDITPDGHK